MWSWRFSWMIERIEDSSNGIKTLENIISDRILPNKLPSSLLVPLVAAVWTFVESCHRLVSGSNLNLFEIGLVVFACCYVCAEDLRLINVLPGVVASQYIVDLLALEGDLVFKSLIDFKHVGARFTKEAEVRKSLLCEQNIGACWTKEHNKGVFCWEDRRSLCKFNFLFH